MVYFSITESMQLPGKILTFHLNSSLAVKISFQKTWRWLCIDVSISALKSEDTDRAHQFSMILGWDLVDVNVLLKAGADVNEVNEGASVNHSDDSGEPLLVKTIEHCTCETVRLLLNIGAYITVMTDHRSGTPLIKAVVLEDIECIKTLTFAGADVNQTNFDKESALMI